MTLSQQIRRDDTIRTLNNEYLTLPSNLYVRVARLPADPAFPFANNVWTTLSFTAAGEEFDTGFTPDSPGTNAGAGRNYRMTNTTGYAAGMWDVLTPTLLTAVKTGTHIIEGCIQFPTAAGQRGLRITHSVAGVIVMDFRNATGGQFGTTMHLCVPYWMKIGETVILEAFQNSGGVLNTGQFTDYCPTFAMARVP